MFLLLLSLQLALISGVKSSTHPVKPSKLDPQKIRKLEVSGFVAEVQRLPRGSDCLCFAEDISKTRRNGSDTRREGLPLRVDLAKQVKSCQEMNGKELVKGGFSIHLSQCVPIISRKSAASGKSSKAKPQPAGKVPNKAPGKVSNTVPGKTSNTAAGVTQE